MTTSELNELKEIIRLYLNLDEEAKSLVAGFLQGLQDSRDHSNLLKDKHL